MNPADLQYIERHVLEAGRVELRAIGPDVRVMGRLFDQPAPLQSTVWNIRKQASLYITIQAPKPLPAANEMGSGSSASRERMLLCGVSVGSD